MSMTGHKSTTCALAACLRGTNFWHLAGLKSISTMLASSTYFISAWEHQGVRYSWRGEGGRLPFAILITLGSAAASLWEKPPGSQVLLHQWSGQDKLFLLFVFPVSPLHQRMGQCFECAAKSNPLSWLYIRMKSDHRKMSYLRRTWVLYPCLSVFPSGLNCRFSLCYFPPNLQPCIAVMVCESISA